ncbi:MAG TPA: DMT family transporter [Deferrisomatales bacterium]|nr:DMT family transporter [Deferrisomatales bacterium]
MRKQLPGGPGAVRRVQAYALVNLATLLWAGNVVLGRALHQKIGPWSLTLARAGIASCLFAVVLWRRRERRAPPTWRDAGLLLGMSLAGVVLFQGLQYTGLHHTTAVNAGLINGAGPLLTVFLARGLLGDPVRPIQVTGALLSLLGVLTIVTGGSVSSLWRSGANPGDLLVLAAVTLWGVYSVLGRLALARRGTFWVTGVSTALAVPLLLVPAAAEVSHGMPVFDATLVLALLYIGAGPSFVAFLAWNEGVRRLGPGGAMAFYNTLPLYIGILSWVALGERPGPSQWLGGALVVGGCLLATRGPPGKARTAP